MDMLAPIPAVPAATVLHNAINRLGLALNLANLMPPHAVAEIEAARDMLKALRAAQTPRHRIAVEELTSSAEISHELAAEACDAWSRANHTRNALAFEAAIAALTTNQPQEIAA